MYDDGSFNVPVETAPPEFELEPITGARIIKRTYAVDYRYYRQGRLHMPDPEFPNCILTAETTGGCELGIQSFTRTFVQVPPSRTVRQIVSFTSPGKSKAIRSRKTAQYIGWDKYGGGAPSTRNVLAYVDYTYAANNGNFSDTPLTHIRYNGVEVDYTGPVYVSVGSVDIGNGQTEERYQFEGFTSPVIAPTTWIEAVEVSQWNGPIWEKKVIRVRNFQ